MLSLMNQKDGTGAQEGRIKTMLEPLRSQLENSNRGLQETVSDEFQTKTEENHETALEENNESGSEEDQEESQDDETVGLRWSERIKSKPKYLEDYVLLSEEEGEILLMFLNDEPPNFEEAKKYKEWVRACEDEIESITRLEC